MADDATSNISNESQIKATEESCGATLQIITSNLSLLSNSDDAACNINKDRSNTMGGTFDIIMEEEAAAVAQVIPVEVAAEAMVKAEAKETNIILQRRAVTVDKFNLAA